MMKRVMRALPALLVVAGVLAPVTVLGQAAPARPASAAKSAIPRMPDGKPNMQGYWSLGPGIAITNIIEEHPAGFGIVASKRVIVDPPDGKFPYQPWAAAEKAIRSRPENSYMDPEGKCAPGGVPHQYHIGRFQIEQPRGFFVMLNDYIHAYRHVDLNRRTHLPPGVKLWQGDSIGRWEGDTLVIDGANYNGKTWMGLGGDFTSDAAHTVERLTMVDANTINFEITITDPKVFTRPVKIAYPFVRGKDEQILEWDCHEGNVDLEHMKNLYDAARKGQ